MEREKRVLLQNNFKAAREAFQESEGGTAALERTRGLLRDFESARILELTINLNRIKTVMEARKAEDSILILERMIEQLEGATHGCSSQKALTLFTKLTDHAADLSRVIDKNATTDYARANSIINQMETLLTVELDRFF